MILEIFKVGGVNHYSVLALKLHVCFVGMYVVSTKPAGFSIEITNQESSLVMTGVRVMLGTQDSQRAPSYIEVHALN
jgi:E3 ubiquitin-protein ligase UBR4